ncbi:MAG: sulfatase [Candidatus Hydrogenedentes bacterium]|nr:sulfatase [Candidatus Hydrogenedentota bacterium]
MAMRDSRRVARGWTGTRDGGGGTAVCAGLILLALTLASCGPKQAAEPPFVRLADGLGGPDGPYRRHLGNEDRVVIYAPYEARGAHFGNMPVPPDGMISLREVVDIDKIHPDALGVRIRSRRFIPFGDPEQGAPPTYAYVALPRVGKRQQVPGTRIRVLPPGEGERFISIRIKEVLPLAREYVTEPIVIARKARLDFGVAFGDDWPFDPVSAEFAVAVECEGQRKELWTRVIEGTGQAVRSPWIDASVDLTLLAGKRVRFAFVTRPVDEADGPAPSFACSAWSCPVLVGEARRRPAPAPNVILISLDTLRPDHLGFYGYERPTSPKLDAFVEQAVVFEQAVAPSTWTTPSHASVFTGLHPTVHEAGIPTKGIELRNEWTTLAELARDRGYLTAAYTEGGMVGIDIGFSQGFDWFSDGDRIDSSMSCARRTFLDGAQWLMRYGHQPFFLFLHTFEVHAPFTPSFTNGRRFDDSYDPDYEPGTFPEFAVSREDRVRCEAAYDGEIVHTDDVVGEFLAQLGEMGLLENTAVIVFSDHGEEFWEHGDFGHTSQVYDEVLRTVLFVRLPGRHPPHGRVAQLVSLQDVFATVVELMDLDCTAPADSMSLLSLIGESTVTPRYARERVVSHLCQNQRGSPQGTTVAIEWTTHSVRTADGKYIRTDKPWAADIVSGALAADAAKTFVRELYDLGADPAEKNNLAAENQGELDGWEADLGRFLDDVGGSAALHGADGPRTDTLSEEAREALQAQGYL